MENGPGIAPSHGFWSRVVRAWFALTRRKIRLLRAGEIAVEGPALFAVSHPAGFLHALVLSLAIERPVHCLLPKYPAHGPLAGFLARHMGIILYEDELPASEATLREALDVLASGGALVVFADHHAARQSAPGALATTAASLVGRAEAQLVGRRIAVYPVHLFLPESTPQPREILIYIDSAIARPAGQTTAVAPDAETPDLATALEARFQENAFQLRPADLEFFLSDLEEVLRTGLQEDWASRPDWKQDTEGFVLSRFVTEWVKQTNYLHPSQLVALRKSLDDYRRLQKQCALRELEVEGGDSPLGTGWRRVLLWFETLLGLPIALYGLVNHWAIALVLFLAGSFKRNSSRPRTTELALRAGVTLAFYILQIFLVAHLRGRAWAGYYAPTLPVSGGYLWRYAGLVRPQARLLFISLTIPALKRKIQRLRHALLKELDHTLTSIEEKTSLSR
jgi:1-acyl-sn-glycerol-3-phosphate acyltransferase